MKIEKIDVNKIDLGKIKHLYIDNYDPNNSDEKLCFETKEFLSQYDNSRFLNSIYLERNGLRKVLFHQFRNEKLNLFDEFYELIGIEVDENDCVWVYDEFFDCDVMFKKDEIILTGDNVLFVNECA